MAAYKKVFSRNSFFSALVFVIFLYLFEESLFDLPQTRSIISTIHFSSKGYWFLWISPIASFLVGCFFVQAALRSSRAFQVIYVFLFTAALLVQYAFRSALQRFMIPADLMIATATPLQMWEGAGALFVDWRFLLPVLAFVFWIFMFGSQRGLKISFIKFAALFLFMVVLNFCYSFRYMDFNLGSSFSSFYQTIARFAVDKVRAPAREPIEWSSAQTPQNNIVLIVDESILADHLSINGYERDTTPFLDKLAETEDGFHNLGVIVSGGTCSYVSNALLLTGVRPGLDDFQKTESYPTIFQYAQAMGYKTYYMDAQTKSLWNGLSERDLPSIDSWLKASDFGDDFDSDFHAADLVVKIVSEGQGNFIVLNKRGVHYLYENDYPPERAIWLPIPTQYVANPTLIVNPYDNGVAYNVNTFFERLLVNPKILENTTILYTSDHGQTLFKNHVTWPHCRNTPQEAMVPLILIGKHLPSVEHSHDASHSNILPTLLDLMNVPPEQRLHSYAPSLFSGLPDTNVHRFFFDSSLHLYQYPDAPEPQP